MKGLLQGPAFPFVAPFALFMGLLYLRQSFPQHSWWLYGVCSLAVFALLLWLRPRYRGQDPAPPRLRDSVLLGLGAIVLWIALDPWMPRSGERDNTFPFAAAFELGLLPGLLSIAFRMFGDVLVVPSSKSSFGAASSCGPLSNQSLKKFPWARFNPSLFISPPLPLPWSTLNSDPPPSLPSSPVGGSAKQNPCERSSLSTPPPTSV